MMFVKAVPPQGVVTMDAVWARLARSQVRRRHTLLVLGVLVLAMLPWVRSAWPEDGWVNRGLEWGGLVLMALAVLGRCACMLYLGGRKGARLVADGPYSVCRNPLYVFSVMAVVGIGLQTGSLVVGLVLGLMASGVFYWVVGEEERLLRVAFGTNYDAYCARVPRFWPRWAGWRSPSHVAVDLQGVWKTLRDAAPYFLSIPIFEAFEAAQDAGLVHVHLWLY